MNCKSCGRPQSLHKHSAKKKENHQWQRIECQREEKKSEA